MIQKQKIEELLNQAIADKDIFVVDLKVSSTNKIIIHVDKVEGITIEECIKISRFIEHELDREVEDFELEVSSPGLSSPFKVKEQYLKNIGRTVEVSTKDGKKTKGKLLSIDDKGINIETTKKVKPEGKKKKVEVVENNFIDFEIINGTKVVIEF